MSDTTLNASGVEVELNVSKAFHSSSAKRKGPGSSRYGTVIECTVIKGKISAGEKIKFNVPDGEPIIDTVIRIEKDKEFLANAHTGDNIGICLQSTKHQVLAAHIN